MSNEEVEIELLRERLNEYRDLLQVSYSIIFRSHEDIQKRNVIRERYKSKLHEHGIIEEQKENGSRVEL